MHETQDDARWESSGQFGLDLDGLIRVGHLRLPNPHYCLLKLVQAAVGWNCRRIVISHTDEQVLVAFEGPGATVDWPGLFRSLHPPGSPLAHLQTGLLGARALGCRHFEIVLAGQAIGVDASGSVLSIEPVADHPEQHRLRLVWPRQSFWRRIFARSRFARMLDLVYRRTYKAAVPIVLDSIVVNSIWPRHVIARLILGHPRLRPDGQVDLAVSCEGDGMYYVLSEANDAQSVLGTPSLHMASYYLTGFKAGKILWWKGSLLGDDEWQAVPSQARMRAVKMTPGTTYTIVAPSELHLPGLFYDGHPAVACRAVIEKAPVSPALLAIYQDGVSWEMESPPELPRGYYYYCSAEGLQSDVSGFRVVKNEAYARLLQSLKKLVELGA